jgi:hypothetical protein
VFNFLVRLAKNVDVSKFIVSKREIVVFECPLSDASRVVDADLHDSRYRSLSIGFIGYNDADLPMVKVEVEFAVPL